jgi:23S rRNA pseudouridine1911/1915/1917 synthase
MMTETTYTVPVPLHKAGTRVDKVLADACPELSRTRIKALIESGRVQRIVRGQPGPTVEDAAYKVEGGQVFFIAVPPATPAVPEPQAIPLDVVYEDDDLIVIDKPPGLVVHPAAGNPDRTLVNALLAHCGGSLSGIGGVGRPGIVHRLDKDTGGLMVAAKNDIAHRGLAEQFASHSLERAYQAVVWGMPQPRAGELSGNIGRSPANRKKMAVVERGGKTALTRYRLLRPVGSRAALVECRLATGRTHQIRVHMAHSGHPVVGDPLYGGGMRRVKAALGEAAGMAGPEDTLALHAVLIGFLHPRTGQSLRFEKLIPSQINKLIEALETV